MMFASSRKEDFIAREKRFWQHEHAGGLHLPRRGTGRIPRGRDHLLPDHLRGHRRSHTRVRHAESHGLSPSLFLSLGARAVRLPVSLWLCAWLAGSVAIYRLLAQITGLTMQMKHTTCGGFWLLRLACVRSRGCWPFASCLPRIRQSCSDRRKGRLWGPNRVFVRPVRRCGCGRSAARSRTIRIRDLQHFFGEGERASRRCSTTIWMCTRGRL